MALWQFIFGAGFGLIVSVLTIMAASNQRRKITYDDERQYISPPDDNCTICLNTMSNREMAYVTCGHAFHETCLRELRKHRQRACPTCRQNI